jgi:hypothetical protein
MTLFVQNDTGGAGTGNVFPLNAEADLFQISNMDLQLGEDQPQQGSDLLKVTYATPPDQTGVCPTRLFTLVNTSFTKVPADPVDIIILAVDNKFTLTDGTLLANFGGVTLPPAATGSGGVRINPTNSVLVIYDTSQGGGTGYCAKGQASGKYDDQTPNPVILYHELSHALRQATQTSLSTSATGCTASPEENAAEKDENDMRDQLKIPHRDPTDHCGQACSGGAGPNTGSCCIVASIATGSPYSAEVNALRQIRDSFLRRSEVGYSFFNQLHYDYYGFSPEVCRMMAVSPQLVALIELYFVKPLTQCLQLIYDYQVNRCSTDELGKRFEMGLTNVPELTQLSLQDLQRVLRLLGDLEQNSMEPELAITGLGHLLAERAASSPYIRWAIMDTISMYVHALLDRLAGMSTVSIGQRFANRIEEWSIQMPLSDIWYTLSRYAIAQELAFLKRALLRTKEAQRRFGQRLVDYCSGDARIVELLIDAGYLSQEAS